VVGQFRAVAARKKKFKDDMAARDTFYRPSEMSKIYPDGKKKKKAKVTVDESKEKSAKEKSVQLKMGKSVARHPGNTYSIIIK